MRLCSLYKMGSNEPGYTGVAQEEKKRKKHTPTTHKEEKRGHPQNLISEKTRRDPSATITRKSQQDSLEGHPARSLTGVIEQLLSAERLNNDTAPSM
jgi:hypothetical protein